MIDNQYAYAKVNELNMLVCINQISSEKPWKVALIDKFALEQKIWKSVHRVLTV